MNQIYQKTAKNVKKKFLYYFLIRFLGRGYISKKFTKIFLGRSTRKKYLEIV
jgi:hypothetical protein